MPEINKKCEDFVEESYDNLFMVSHNLSSKPELDDTSENTKINSDIVSDIVSDSTTESESESSDL